MTEPNLIDALSLLVEARDLLWYIGNGTTDEELVDIANRIHKFYASFSTETRMQVREVE